MDGMDDVIGQARLDEGQEQRFGRGKVPCLSAHNGDPPRDVMPDNVILLTRRVHAVFKQLTDVGSRHTTRRSLDARVLLRN